MARLSPSSRIAYQGESGAFSEEAALLLSASAPLVPCRYFPELFASIAESRAEFILAPVENTLAGAVTDSYDLLLRSKLFITAEVILPIHHQLIGVPGAKLSEVRTVLSHPVALAQCRKLFAEYPMLKAEATDDTAGSVRQIMECGDAASAAIASERACAIYGAQVLAQNIEDNAQNFTRFLLLSVCEGDSRGDKFSLAVRLNPSMLSAALRRIESGGAELLHIVSRPVEGSPWEYVFFMDFSGASPDEHRLGELFPFARAVRWLGQYQNAVVSAKKG